MSNSSQVMVQTLNRISFRDIQKVTKVLLAQFGSDLADVAGHMLLQHCPSVGRIYYKCLEIVNTVVDFVQKRLTVKSFIFNMTNHGYNLYILLKEEIKLMRGQTVQFLSPFFDTNSPPQLIYDVAGTTDNDVMELNDVNEELPEVDNDETNTPEDDRAKYEIILDLVQRKVCFMGTNDSVLLIKTFIKELNQVTRQITSQVQKEYDDIISYNVSCLGEEKAKLILSKICVNSKIDFAEKVFGQIIKNMESGSLPVTDPSAVLNKLIAQIRKIFTIVSDRNDVKKMSVQETCEILEKLTPTFMEPFIETYSFASDFYARNSSIFGKRYGRVMLLEALDIKDDRDIGPELNQDTIFDVALKKTNAAHEILDYIFT